MKAKDQVTPKLYEFLSKKKVLTKFMKNAKSKKANGILAVYPTATVNNIISSFYWGDVPEGCTFWSTLSDEFESL